MKPNPGGVISGKEIIGRDIEIDKIWTALEKQSVVLTSERRVGKTSVLRKMEENPKNGWTPILYFVEGKWNPIEFVEGLYETLLAKGMIEDKFHWLKKFYKEHVGGEQVFNWKLPAVKENWKLLLESIMADITAVNKKAILMFDELPHMIYKFKQAPDCGPRVAMDFLDTLRELRNKYEVKKKVTFIFCGSIGIHLVIKDLKRNHGYNADPVNNMKIITLESMNKDDANLLCEKLSENGDSKFDNKKEIFRYICEQTDSLPFYIQLVFDFIYGSKEKIATKTLVEKAIEYLLDDPSDEGFFRHYLDRIQTYYDDNIKNIALIILNKTCMKSDYWEENDIINLVKNYSSDEETIKDAINLLWSDQYLIRKIKKDKRYYCFKYNIIRNWWKRNRG